MLKRLLLVLALALPMSGCVVYDGYAEYPPTEMVWVSGVTYYRDIYVSGEVHRCYYVWHPGRGYVYHSRVVVHGRFR